MKFNMYENVQLLPHRLFTKSNKQFDAKTRTASYTKLVGEFDNKLSDILEKLKDKVSHINEEEERKKAFELIDCYKLCAIRLKEGLTSHWNKTIDSSDMAWIFKTEQSNIIRTLQYMSQPLDALINISNFSEMLVFAKEIPGNSALTGNITFSLLMFMTGATMLFMLLATSMTTAPIGVLIFMYATNIAILLSIPVLIFKAAQAFQSQKYKSNFDDIIKIILALDNQHAFKSTTSIELTTLDSEGDVECPIDSENTVEPITSDSEGGVGCLIDSKNTVEPITSDSEGDVGCLTSDSGENICFVI